MLAIEVCRHLVLLNEDVDVIGLQDCPEAMELPVGHHEVVVAP